MFWLFEEMKCPSKKKENVEMNVTTLTTVKLAEMLNNKVKFRPYSMSECVPDLKTFKMRLGNLVIQGNPSFSERKILKT